MTMIGTWAVHKHESEVDGLIRLIQQLLPSVYPNTTSQEVDYPSCDWGHKLRCTIVLINLSDGAAVFCLNLSFDFRNQQHHRTVSPRDMLRPKISQFAHFAAIAGHKPSNHGTSSGFGLCLPMSVV